MPIKDPAKRKEYQLRWLLNNYPGKKKQSKGMGGDGHDRVVFNTNKKGDAKFLAALAPFKKYG